jgi:release factor glutamine methyltransferase
VIASNPPYIPTATIATLQPEVRDFEPTGALDGGEDGLEIIRRLIAEAPMVLRPRGALVLEVAAGQAAEVASLAGGSAFGGVAITRDLARIERVVTLQLA